MNHNDIFSLSFPEAKTIIVSGDIHGDFNQLTRVRDKDCVKNRVKRAKIVRFTLC